MDVIKELDHLVKQIYTNIQLYNITVNHMHYNMKYYPDQIETSKTNMFIHFYKVIFEFDKYLGMLDFLFYLQYLIS